MKQRANESLQRTGRNAAVFGTAFWPAAEFYVRRDHSYHIQIPTNFLQSNCNKIVDTVTISATINSMIKSFKHKGLAELFERGCSRRVRHDLQSRSLRRLDALNQADSLIDLNVPGFNFHGLQGRPKRYSIHVNGPWCITVEWEEGEALRVDLEQYH